MATDPSTYKDCYASGPMLGHKITCLAVGPVQSRLGSRSGCAQSGKEKNQRNTTTLLHLLRPRTQVGNFSIGRPVTAGRTRSTSHLLPEQLWRIGQKMTEVKLRTSQSCTTTKNEAGLWNTWATVSQIAASKIKQLRDNTLTQRPWHLKQDNQLVSSPFKPELPFYLGWMFIDPLDKFICCQDFWGLFVRPPQSMTSSKALPAKRVFPVNK